MCGDAVCDAIASLLACDTAALACCCNLPELPSLCASKAISYVTFTLGSL